MIREIIKPQYSSFTIDIPSSYINKEVEFIMFPLDSEEINKIENAQKSNKNITKSLFGALEDSDITLSDYKDYLEDKYLWKYYLIQIKSLENNGKDFEDSVIYTSAEYFNIDVIITRDKKGFKQSNVKILSPNDFLEEYK